MLGKVSDSGVQEGASVNIYTSKANPFVKDFKMLSLKGSGDGEIYKFRILPPNYDEARFGATDKFFVIAPQHFGVGTNAKEFTLCPEKALDTKAHIKCPLCGEYKGQGSSKRASVTPYYYMNAILLSDNQYVDSKKTIKTVQKKDAKTGKYIVYTIKVSKKQVFDAIAAYYKNPNRKVKDPCDLVYGCAVQIKATSKIVDKHDMTQFETAVLEDSKGNVTSVINVDDIKDLRLITEYIPTAKAVQNMMEGMGVADSMELAGKVHSATGKVTAGVGMPVGAVDATSNDIPDAPDMETIEADEIDGVNDFLKPVDNSELPDTTGCEEKKEDLTSLNTDGDDLPPAPTELP